MIAEDLRASVSEGRWDDVARIFDRGFLRLLHESPDAIAEAFSAVPDGWFDRYPRHLMSLGIAASELQKILLVDEQTFARFVAWVESQSTPKARDVLGVLCGRIRERIALARYQEAADLAEEVLSVLARAKESEGFHDVLPSVFLLCGGAKILVGGWDRALGFYGEAVRWAGDVHGHPLGTAARQHLALGYALTGRYRTAREVLDASDQDDPPASPIMEYFQSSALVARWLIAAARFDDEEATALEQVALDGRVEGEWWWMLTHCRAVSARIAGSPFAVIQDLEEQLARTGMISPPSSSIGSLLRADLATLYQQTGNLRAADRVLRAPGMRESSPMTLARARQLLLRNQPARARVLLESSSRAAGDDLWHGNRPEVRVILCAVEYALTGGITDESARSAASAIERNDAFTALLEAPERVQERIEELLPGAPRRRGATPLPEPPALTRREKEMVAALSTGATMAQIGEMLHISTNTVRTHAHALYRKLGVHNRKDAVWVAGGGSPESRG